jgi:transposase InsO family protein
MQSHHWQQHPLQLCSQPLDQDFAADGPNQKMADGITCTWTIKGWLYLAVMLDLSSRRVIGRAVSNRLKRDFSLSALNIAATAAGKAALIIRIAQQYYSEEYARDGFKVFLSGNGNCCDISVVETIFKSHKTELILRNRFEIRRKAESPTFKYLNGF